MQTYWTISFERTSFIASSMQGVCCRNTTRYSPSYPWLYASSWTSFWFIHVCACHCKFAKFQQQTVVVVNLFKLKWRSITSWKLKVCIHQTPKFVVKIFFFLSVFSATQLIIFFFCMCLLHISWTNFGLKRETHFQSQCPPNMLHAIASPR